MLLSEENKSGEARRLSDWTSMVGGLKTRRELRVEGLQKKSVMGTCKWRATQRIREK